MASQAALCVVGGAADGCVAYGVRAGFYGALGEAVVRTGGRRGGTGLRGMVAGADGAALAGVGVPPVDVVAVLEVGHGITIGDGGLSG